MECSQSTLVPVTFVMSDSGAEKSHPIFYGIVFQSKELLLPPK
jgi:hypothetical protein